jgi:hypothetical protein
VRQRLGQRKKRRDFDDTNKLSRCCLLLGWWVVRSIDRSDRSRRAADPRPKILKWLISIQRAPPKSIEAPCQTPFLGRRRVHIKFYDGPSVACLAIRMITTTLASYSRHCLLLFCRPTTPPHLTRSNAPFHIPTTHRVDRPSGRAAWVASDHPFQAAAAGSFFS